MPKLKTETHRPTAAENKRINAGIAQDPDNPEWTKAEFAQAKPAEQFFDAQTYSGLVELTRRGRGKRGLQKEPTKVPVSVRFDPDVLEKLRSTGRGWATFVNDTMREVLFGTPKKASIERSARKTAR